MQINIDNLKIETIDYIDSRGYNHPKKGIRDLKKIVSVKFNTNSILVDVLKHQLKYYPYIKANWYKGKNTDSLFLELIGVNHQLIQLFNRYNKILSSITYKEQQQLNYIRDNSYITKKYSCYDDVLDNEYGVYEPINTVDNYNDYDNCYNQSFFKNKRINYDKNQNIKKDVVTKTLEQACKLITDFKLSVIDKKINCFKNNKLDCIAIFNYMIGKKDKKLKTYYKVAKKEKATYNNYNEFIKCVVCYGASHPTNNRFWQIIKRELY